MARRSLSTQGRVLAAGVSVVVGSALAGFMAARDHSADASTKPTPSATSSNDGGRGSTAVPYNGGSSSDDGVGGASTGASSDSGGSTGFQPQPQTRTGGS